MKSHPPERVQKNASAAAPSSARGSSTRSRFLVLTLGSIGVVYGDIGTSPLYAFREAAVAAAAGGPITQPLVLGVLSLMIWALIIIVTIKYVFILLNADNKGEGGTLSLMALVRRATAASGLFALSLGLIGTALFFGDALITPAISVLSAIEGLKLATPGIEPFIIPLTIVILVALFLVQKRGTAKVAAFFGPITSLWFIAIAAVGARQIIEQPVVLFSFSPTYAFSFLIEHGWIALFTLGAVFLTVTGAEALYADLGHFGRRPIQTAWLFFVLPCLTLNYLGQGSLVLGVPEALENPFYRAVPSWGLLPMVALATAATVIASQAVITGAFSLARQAVQLGLLPRLEVQHTSEAQSGQIYMPQVNLLLLIGVLFLVVLFKNSSALGTAYGIAVTGTMIVTAMLAFILMRKVWRWPLWLASVVMLPLIAVDATFLMANLLKIVSGGWVPLFIGAMLILVMITWIRGANRLLAKTRRIDTPLPDLIAMMSRRPPAITKGVAVFLTADPDNAPTALMHSLKHYKVLHEHNVILTVRFTDEAHVPNTQRLEQTELSPLFSKVIIRFGFMDAPNVPKALGMYHPIHGKFEVASTSFFLSRRSLQPSRRGGMPLWQDKLFIFLARNASDATAYFQIPTDRAVEIGTRITI
jgi:KUP system potassium uptake protein